MTLETLWEPFTLDFMWQALVIGLLVSAAAAALSCLLVLKGWSLMGDAVSHAVLPGIVIAHLLSIPLLIGAFISGMFCAIATGYLSNNSRLKEDTVMGIVFSGLFALGVALFTQIHTDLHLDHVLFGDMLGVSWRDVLLTAALVVPALLLVVLRRKDLLVFAFDPQHAGVIGLNVTGLHYGLLAVLSLVIVASIKAVGIILVISILIAPGAIAYLLTNRFENMLWWAIGIALLATFLGVNLSYHIDSAPAPTIVVLLTIIFIVVFLFAPKQGLFRQTRFPEQTA
ncbi:MAG: metal ABC transporter permease [Granulosicoccus sp.]